MFHEQRWFQENISGFSGQLFLNEPLAKYTYYRIGGPASVMAVPQNREDLIWLAKGIKETGIPFFILGSGSNLLVADGGFQGLVIRSNRLNLGIESLECSDKMESIQIRTGGSVAISSFLRKAAQEGWAELEFLTGIPGSIGGAVRMNAGTHLGEVQKQLCRVEAFNLSDENKSTLIFEKDQLSFEYRKNLFLPPTSVVVSADWRVKKGNPQEVKAMISGVLARRKATQPLDYPSCGSVFKNPKPALSLAGIPNLQAWQVVDRLGLRGYRVGDAQFSEKHCNFIINLGSARASDVCAVIEIAKNRALKELGIVLEEEVIYLG